MSIRTDWVVGYAGTLLVGAAMQTLATRFVHCGNAQIAYQVYGRRCVEALICGGSTGRIEIDWERS